jgi:hypothetical protein
MALISSSGFSCSSRFGALKFAATVWRPSGV